MHARKADKFACIGTIPALFSRLATGIHHHNGPSDRQRTVRRISDKNVWKDQAGKSHQDGMPLKEAQMHGWGWTNTPIRETNL